MAGTKQYSTPNSLKRVGKFAVVVYAVGLLGAVVTKVFTGGGTIESFLFFGLIGPTALLVGLVVIGGAIYAIGKFWLWTLPHWIAYMFHLAKWPSLALYTGILACSNVFVAFLCGYWMTPWGLVYCMVFVAGFSALMIGHAAHQFNPRHMWYGALLTKKGLAAKRKIPPSYAEAHKDIPKQQLAKQVAYDALVAKDAELPPDLPAFINVCIARINSYASLQTGVDPEDNRIVPYLRAGLMAQSLVLRANGYDHMFSLQPGEITHIEPIPQSNQHHRYIVRLTALVVDETVRAESAKKSMPRPIHTPYILLVEAKDGDVSLLAVHEQQSQIALSKTPMWFTDFVDEHQLFQPTTAAHALIPTTGIFADKTKLPKMPHVQNVAFGHTNEHAFSICSIGSFSPFANNESYIVGCTVVPKQHDRIIITNKRSRLSRDIEKLPMQRITTESSNFSDKYAICITQESTVPYFELLTPASMTILEAVKSPITIEATGDRLYYYMPIMRTSKRSLSTMYAVMSAIHQQLHL